MKETVIKETDTSRWCTEARWTAESRTRWIWVDAGGSLRRTSRNSWCSWSRSSRTISDDTRPVYTASIII